MFAKLIGITTVLLVIVCLASGGIVLAQDVCVSNYMANLALPTTVTELRQYINDLREVLSECDPVSEDAIQIEVQPVADLNNTYEDANSCDVLVFLGSRLQSPSIIGLVAGNSRISSLLERKIPGESKFDPADRTDDEILDDVMLHIWDDTDRLPMGRYEVRYEPFIGAEPVTVAFEVEYNAEHRFVVSC